MELTKHPNFKKKYVDPGVWGHLWYSILYYATTTAFFPKSLYEQDLIEREAGN